TDFLTYLLYNQLLFYASSLSWLEVHAVTGHEGQDVTVQCSHTLARSNGKYFCKGHCSRDADVLIKTEEGQRNKKIGRLSLYDNGTGTFWVTITGLKKTDTGTYWCAVKRSIIADTFTEVSLTVLDGTVCHTASPHLSLCAVYMFFVWIFLLLLWFPPTVQRHVFQLQQ
uniref:Immunoglobulin domain-containing protein n=1 Tax=Scleropages formosus TaxID=113540 RepID=A0A8C9V756_SCLFO